VGFDRLLETIYRSRGRHPVVVHILHLAVKNVRLMVHEMLGGQLGQCGLRLTMIVRDLPFVKRDCMCILAP